DLLRAADNPSGGNRETTGNGERRPAEHYWGRDRGVEFLQLYFLPIPRRLSIGVLDVCRIHPSCRRDLKDCRLPALGRRNHAWRVHGGATGTVRRESRPSNSTDKFADKSTSCFFGAGSGRASSSAPDGRVGAGPAALDQCD